MSLKLFVRLTVAFCMISSAAYAMEKEVRGDERRAPRAAYVAQPVLPAVLPTDESIRLYERGLDRLQKGGPNLQQDKDREAERCFVESRHPQAYNELGWMCLKGRARLDLRTQQERDKVAEDYFRASYTPTALVNLALMYAHKRAGADLTPYDRYITIRRLLREANTDKAKETLKWYETHKLPPDIQPVEERCVIL